MKYVPSFILILIGLILATPATAQSLTVGDYARAEGFLSRYMSPLVYRAEVSPEWMEGGRFWYSVSVPGGNEFVLVDPSVPSRGHAFDHGRMLSALNTVSGDQRVALPSGSLDFGLGQATFQAGRQAVICSMTSYTCTRSTEAAGSGSDGGGRFFRSPDVASPDGTMEAFIRDNNLWVRVTSSGEEFPLTTDGAEDYGYGTNNAGWTKSERPVLEWSPDSKKIATFRHDGRRVSMMYMVNTQVGAPELEAWRYPFPGDDHIFMIERVVLHVDDRSVVKLDMPPDAHRSTITDHVAYGGGWADVQWSDDSERLFFVSSSRDHKSATLREADIHTGAVRDILEETVDTFFESGYRNINWSVHPERNQVIWYSRRSDWGHLYLYDLETGSLIKPLTEGDWNVLAVDAVEGDHIVFTGAGRDGSDPYYQYLYRVDMRTGDLVLLTPSTGNHSIQWSPDRAYFVDTWSTPVEPPVSILRESDGRAVIELESADISALLAAGWQPPTRIQTKARDGETDIYGLMYTPTHLDPAKKYPVLNYVYPGPQSGSVGSRSFSAARGDKQAIAELGFVVIEVDAMGTPMRSQSFHEAYYGNMGDNGIPDQIAAIRQMAAAHPFIDLDRVGIWGHSGGGFASTAAILDYPDFYKVAVSQAGNHDNATYEDDWGEKWHGLLETYEDGSTNYDSQANHLKAHKLKGKLLLAHGTMDGNVPPNNTLLVVNALIDANKDFDLIMFPNRRHGFGNEPYMMRRRWDYFVEHLMGAEPPREFTFGQQD
jgi:dipeptidyl aminopeptidase/acylaminoacyl peptidase